MTLLLVPGMAFAETDIDAVCYDDCEAATHSNPDYKACVARAADKADAALNQAYRSLQDKIRAAGKDMGQSPDIQLADLKDRRSNGSPTAMAIARWRTVSPSAARRSAATIRHASAR
jgi:uncharacterized protein YecT (DUF1311 family)